MADPLGFLDAELEALSANHLLREARPGSWTDAPLNLCSNDYLGYGGEPLPSVLPFADPRSGAGASRLVFGDCSSHREAEQALAAWVGRPAALLFTSGYAANLGTLQALAGAGDVIISDSLNHASIIDGCRLSRATTVVVPHLDLGATAAAFAAHASARRLFVVTESVFSMDGDGPDLPALRGLCDRFDATLIVDEAHALGIVGDDGGGACVAAGVEADVVIGTCGKALGLQGAFVAGPETLRTWLWNRARSFVFSTGLSPAIAAAVAPRVARAKADTSGRGRVLTLADDLRRAVKPGASCSGRGPIVPWILGSASGALRAAGYLRERGVLVQAIRSPTVPEGSARIRLTASASLLPRERDAAVAAIADAVGQRFT